MTVTPQVNENESVSLNIRPTITRITGFAIDPAPRLARVQFDNLIPEIQIREMESLLKVMSGETVVMGGLMQDKLDDSQSSLPWISRIPILGSLFKYKKKTVIKTELVIFLRPKLILNASLNGDFIEYRRYLNSNQSPPPGKQP